VTPSYVQKLLSAFHDAAKDERQRAKEEDLSSVSRPSSLVEPLTEREMEVLHLVAAGLSNQEIADRLVITLGTVKSHTNSIYGKLGVKSRTQAIARAKALDWT
jgi:ATP/maltotriose-dependent transcriptional regulator MalT